MTHDVTMQVVRKAKTEGGACLAPWFERLSESWFADQGRLIAVPDQCSDLADLKGDCFNPKVNTDIPADQLAREEADFEDRVNRLGVFGLVGQIRVGEAWETVDSCFGFVGEDFIGSGYDRDIACSVLAALDRKVVAS